MLRSIGQALEAGLRRRRLINRLRQAIASAPIVLDDAQAPEAPALKSDVTGVVFDNATELMGATAKAPGNARGSRDEFMEESEPLPAELHGRQQAFACDTLP
jgi:hypothetical protein